MSKVILICGKICSGKTTYAKSLIKSKFAVLLSVDEITVALFGTDAGEHHDFFVEKTQTFLYQKSLEIIESGITVILDWGFWTKEDRREAVNFYNKHNIQFEWHYIDASKEVLNKNLEKRNQAIKNEQISFYYFDDELSNHFWNMFEVPQKDEIDVWYISPTV